MLNHQEILEAASRPLPPSGEDSNEPVIRINPFDEKCVNPNSYNVHLGKFLTTYDRYGSGRVLDFKSCEPTQHIEIDDEGFVLKPGILYLGHTVETTLTLGCVPVLHGRSSAGRLGLSVHVTAGLGDIGFHGQWVFEIHCLHPIRVYPNIPIAQLSFTPTSKSDIIYRGKYQAQHGPVGFRPDPEN